ncbi:MAG: hypothetical protein Athens101426_384 [Parcubacteria group bacterium Athens1014_26]|nr:MAG: hypothetical protein Athens101426_384 [Parcubacteria group bacterium Athens1014_26]
MSASSEKKIVLAAICIYIIVFGVFTGLRHYNFQTQAWDMGIFDQTFWNTAHGRFMENSFETAKNHLGIHMSPFLVLLAPGYALFPSPYFLLIIQTIALALGAWPLYLLAKKVLSGFDKKWPVIITLFDFHELPFLIPLLLTSFYFIETKKWLWTTIFLALSASVKEDAILVVMFMGIYIFIKSGKNKSIKETQNIENKKFLGIKKFGALTAIFSLIYFIAATKIIMPSLGGGLLSINRYSQLGGSVAEIAKNLFTNPWLFIKTIFAAQKMGYVFWLLVPAGFMTLFSGPVLLTLVPPLAENLLSSWNSQVSGLYHYDALLIAGIFAGLVYGLKFFLNHWPKKQKIAIVALLVAGAASFLIRSPISPFLFPTELFRPNAHWDAYREIIKKIPANASVAAQTNLVPHLSKRQNIYVLGTEPSPADILIIDGADLTGFTDEKTFQTYADSYMDSGLYNFTAIENRYFILNKKDIELLQ